MDEKLVSIKVRHELRSCLKTRAAQLGVPIYRLLDDLVEKAALKKHGDVAYKAPKR